MSSIKVNNITNESGTSGPVISGITTVNSSGFMRVPVGSTGRRLVSDFVPNNIIDDGLVLYLDAGNAASYSGSGTTWTDLSGQGNNGTLVNGVGYSGDNLGSLSFDGVDDYVDCGNASSLNINSTITLSAWVKLNSLSGEIAIIGKGGTAGHHFGIYLQRIILQPQASYQLSNTTLLINNWYNIVATYDKSTVKFYLNGLSDGIQSLTGGLNAPNDPVWIGRYLSAIPLHPNGFISSASIYNKALTASEVQQNYNALRYRYEN